MKTVKIFAVSISMLMSASFTGADRIWSKAIGLSRFKIRFGEPPKPAREPRALPRFKVRENKMPDVDSYDSSSGIAVDVQQRLNCALP